MLYEFRQMKTTELYHMNLNFVVSTHQDFLLGKLKQSSVLFLHDHFLHPSFNTRTLNFSYNGIPFQFRFCLFTHFGGNDHLMLSS